jgi:hypothetical protein
LGDSAVFFCFFLTAGQSLCEKPKIKVVVDIEKKKKPTLLQKRKCLLYRSQYGIGVFEPCEIISAVTVIPESWHGETGSEDEFSHCESDQNARSLDCTQWALDKLQLSSVELADAR